MEATGWSRYGRTVDRVGGGLGKEIAKTTGRKRRNKVDRTVDRFDLSF